jgi:hypothetical protein
VAYSLLSHHEEADMMKYIAAALLAAQVLVSGAHADQSGCKRLGAGSQGACKQQARKPRALEQGGGGGLTAAERSVLDRAHTRTQLDNIQMQLSRPR